jgi:hypothetical protein
LELTTSSRAQNERSLEEKRKFSVHFAAHCTVLKHTLIALCLALLFSTKISKEKEKGKVLSKIDTLSKGRKKKNRGTYLSFSDSFPSTRPLRAKAVP